MADNLGTEAMSYMIEDVIDVMSSWQAQKSEDEVRRCKGKGKEVEAPSIISYSPVSSSPASAVGTDDEEEQEVDWKQYEPPAGLKIVEGIESEIIKQLVQQSIENVQSRIAEERNQRRREAAEELERLRQECEAGAKTKSAEEADAQSFKQSNDDEESSKAELQTPAIPRFHRVEPATFAGVELVIDENGLLRPAPALPSKSKKRTLMGLLRRFNNANNERGESSAQGAARSRQSLAAGNLDLNTFTSRGKTAVDVVKQVVISKSPREPIHEEDVECVSCLEDFRPKDMINASCHSYCLDCFSRLIQTACENEQHWPPKCCLNDLPKTTIASGLSRYPDLERTYKEKCEERSVPMGERIYCSEPLCGLFIKPDQINRSIGAARCSMGHWICILCRGPQHELQACPQDRDLQRTEELAQEEGWKRCHQCHAFVEHREACQHMTCRCGAEFCYVCGARWRTCACTMEQLHAHKQAADSRRYARDLRQTREEAEVAEALRLIEEFEREEERKAILLRLERERVERERREEELRERLQREEKRCEAVRVKFQELRQLLENLYQRQRFEIIGDHGKEENLLTYEAQSSLTALKEQNGVGRNALAIEGNKRLAKVKKALVDEYVVRVQQEREVEEEYQRQLHVYWSDKADGDVQIEAALLSLKRRMDRGHRAWSKWMQKELDTQHFLVQEEQTIQIELMNETEKRLSRENKHERQAFLKRKRAELEWTDVVIQERETMLRALEDQDIGDGDDMADLLAEGGSDEWVAVDELDEYRVPGAFR